MVISLVAQTLLEYFNLFLNVRNKAEITTIQKGTILDDTLPDVQAFLNSRVMLLQLFM